MSSSTTSSRSSPALLAARWGRPAVRTSPVFAANEHYSIWEDLRRSQGFQLLEDVEAPRHAMLALLREYGVRSGIREFWDAVEDLNIVFMPRSFQVAGDTFDDRFVFVGPSYPKPRFDADWRPPADGSPVVLISLGTQFNERPEFFRACAEALAGTEWHAVMAIGAALDPASLEPLPPNVEAHQWVPFVRVLEHATVFMTHGTTGAVMDGLYWGRPLAILPDVAAEAAPSADRVVDLGLGHRLRAEDLGAGRLDAALRRLAGDSAVRERVRLMQDDVRQAGGPLRAADAIEAYVRNPTARAAFSG
ncbi:macrolide family glycosyltransferase [Actinoallomurus acanthiterrae]